MNTLTIEALPEGLELAPSERAWDAFDYIINHPDGWDQKWYGNRMIDGTVAGCFAYHVVARAGFTITAAHPAHPNAVMYIPTGEIAEEIDRARLRGAFSRLAALEVPGHVTVPQLAQHLLSYNTGGECTTCWEPRLFCPTNDLARLGKRAVEMFGPKPVAA